MAMWAKAGFFVFVLCGSVVFVGSQTTGATETSRPSFRGMVNAILAIGKFRQAIAAGGSCITGEGDDYSSKECHSRKTHCLTKIVYNHDLVHVTRECKEEEPCKHLQSENKIQCRGAEAQRNKVQICHYCCKGDDCNNNDALGKILEKKANAGRKTEKEVEEK